MRWPEPVRHAAIEVAYRLGGWPRRLAAVLCLVAAVWSVVQGRRDPAPPTTGVVIAAHDLGAGTVLGHDDVRLTQWPTGIVPGAALHNADGAVGAIVGAPVGRGEPITQARLQGHGVATGLPAGWVAITVVADNAAAATLIHPGDHVDVLSATPDDALGTDVGPARARLEATDVRVLAVLTPPGDQGTGQPTSVVLGADRSTSLALASFGATP